MRSWRGRPRRSPSRGRRGDPCRGLREIEILATRRHRCRGPGLKIVVLQSPARFTNGELDTSSSRSANSAATAWPAS